MYIMWPYWQGSRQCSTSWYPSTLSSSSSSYRSQLKPSRENMNEGTNYPHSKLEILNASQRSAFLSSFHASTMAPAWNKYVIRNYRNPWKEAMMFRPDKHEVRDASSDGRADRSAHVRESQGIYVRSAFFIGFKLIGNFDSNSYSVLISMQACYYFLCFYLVELNVRKMNGLKCFIIG